MLIQNSYKLFFLLFVIPCSFLANERAYSRNQELYVSKPNTTKSLSQVQVTSIVQDKGGKLWLGTHDGLNAYNGYDYEIFRPSYASKNQLRHHKIRVVHYSTTHGLMIGTSLGLQVYDEISKKFYDVRFADKIKNKPLTVSAILETKRGEVYIGTFYYGLIKLSKDMQIEQVLNSSNSLLSSNFIISLLEETSGEVWVGTKGQLYTYNSTKNLLSTFAEKKYKASELLNNRRIGALSEINNNIWVGTDIGLFHIDKKNMKVQYDTDFLKTSRLTNININKILLLSDSREIAVGTNGNGLFILSDDNRLREYFGESELEKRKKLNNFIISLYDSGKNKLWVGTMEGFGKISLETNKFQHYSPNSKDFECIHSREIYGVAIENKQIIWVSSLSKGLQKIDLNTKKCTNKYKINLNGITTNLSDILSIHYSSRNSLLIGTKLHGLIEYFSDTDKFKHHTQIPLNARVTSIIEGKEFYLITTHYQNLFIINKVTGISKKIISDSINLSAYNALLSKDNKSLILATRRNGLVKIAMDGTLIKSYKDLFSHEPEIIRDIKRDKKGNIWLATQGYGAYRISSDESSITQFNLENSQIASNMLWHIEIDNTDRVWFSSSKGMTVYNPKTDSFENYTKKDGLQDDPFTPTGQYDPKTDMMLTGGINGFNYFSPSDIHPQTRMLNTYITDFKINYKDSDRLRNQTIQAQEENIDLLLNHDENVISFKFSSMDYSDPERIKFAYLMEGVNNQWTEVDSSIRFANYTNLDSGKYTFKVKAANIHGRWSDKIRTVKIKILPPWWKTTLAYIIYSIIFFLSIYLFIVLRTKRLTKINKQLTSMVDNKTNELLQEKNKIEKLLSKKMKNLPISHTNLKHHSLSY